ncbi:hypothetical protein C8J57DRAFT_1242789 [Mycena rebaudengoi]|nr:hypothetical protein C8J57DRAFT_1242789 [Mycena rebaudengoi]
MPPGQADSYSLNYKDDARLIDMLENDDPVLNHYLYQGDDCNCSQSLCIPPIIGGALSSFCISMLALVDCNWGPPSIHTFQPPTELITEVTCSLGLGLLTFNHYLCTPISDIRHGLSCLYDPVWGLPIDLMGWSGIFRLTSCSFPICIWGIVLSHLMSSELACRL